MKTLCHTDFSYGKRPRSSISVLVNRLRNRVTILCSAFIINQISGWSSSRGIQEQHVAPKRVWQRRSALLQLLNHH